MNSYRIDFKVNWEPDYRHIWWRNIEDAFKNHPYDIPINATDLYCIELQRKIILQKPCKKRAFCQICNKDVEVKSVIDPSPNWIECQECKIQFSYLPNM